MFASLLDDQRSFALTAVVVLILRTVDLELYFQFNRGEATDLEAVDGVFARNPGLRRLQLEHPGCVFEVMIVFAAREVSGRFDESIESPLLARYEKLRDPEALDSVDRKQATRVLDVNRKQHAGLPRRFGFLETVSDLSCSHGGCSVKRNDHPTGGKISGPGEERRRIKLRPISDDFDGRMASVPVMTDSCSGSPLAQLTLTWGRGATEVLFLGRARTDGVARPLASHGAGAGAEREPRPAGTDPLEIRRNRRDLLPEELDGPVPPTV